MMIPSNHCDQCKHLEWTDRGEAYCRVTPRHPVEHNTDCDKFVPYGVAPAAENFDGAWQPTQLTVKRREL